MATSASPRIVASMTNPHVQYSVTRESCTCPAFSFQRRRDPAYLCKHIRAAFPPRPARRVRYCAHCHVDIAIECSCFCSDRCRDLSAAATIPAVEPALAIPAFTPTATCLSCQQPYPYSDESYQTRLYCPECRHEPVRAGHGWGNPVQALAN